MESKQETEKQWNSGKTGEGKNSRYEWSYKLKLVKLRLEEGIPVAVLAKEAKMPPKKIHR